jgi:putative transposase
MKWSNAVGEDTANTLMSHTGHRLTRPVAFKFTLDPTEAQAAEFFMCAGASRFCFNYHVAAIKTNLDVRATEREAGVAKAAMTPSLSWSGQSRINEFNAWKNGQAANSTLNEDGSKGLAWRAEVPADVFECASVDAARALSNFSQSRTGARAGRPVGFVKFKSRHKTAPAFRLRSQSTPGKVAPVRFTDAHHLRLGRLGAVRVHGQTRQLRRMLDAGRFHTHSVTVKYHGGRWHATVAGVAAVFHPARRKPTGRQYGTVGVDLGIKTLAVAADSHGTQVNAYQGVNALRTTQQQLRRANKTYARTKPGSVGRTAAKRRLQRLHARISHQRQHLAHQITTELVRSCDRLVIEDLNVAGMGRLRTLARALADCGLGDLRRLFEYKANWYGTELVIADRWFASSKTCSRCGHIKPTLLLSERIYACEHCDMSIDRDLNAAINLACWPDRHKAPAASPPVQPKVLVTA